MFTVLWMVIPDVEIKVRIDKRAFHLTMLHSMDILNFQLYRKYCVCLKRMHVVCPQAQDRGDGCTRICELWMPEEVGLFSVQCSEVKLSNSIKSYNVSFYSWL